MVVPIHVSQVSEDVLFKWANLIKGLAKKIIWGFVADYYSRFESLVPISGNNQLETPTMALFCVI